MTRSKKKISDKTIGIMIGIALTISAIGVIGIVSVSYAHNHSTNNMMSNDMMSGNMMPMMHSTMGGDGNMMNCMGVMNDALSDGKVTQEEMEEMIQQMDKDGDGQCDYCGMSIEACRNMMHS